MCDPVSLALGAGSLLFGNKQKAPPAPELPALELQKATAETGADIILGGERDEDLEDENTNSALPSLTRKTKGSGLNTRSSRSGVNIL